jgi:hypothetical protein
MMHGPERPVTPRSGAMRVGHGPGLAVTTS